MRVFGAHINKALRRLHRQTRNHHPLNQGVRIRLHQQTVGKRARVALIGIAHHIFLRRILRQHRLPLNPRRKRRTAATAQSRIQHRLHHRRRIHVQSPSQTHPAAMRLIIIQTQRIGQSDARKGQTLLPAQIRVLIHHTNRAIQRRTFEQTRRQPLWQGIRRRTGIAHASALGFHLNQRLQPEHAARTVTHDANLLPMIGCPRLQGCDQIIRPQSQSRGIHRNINGFHDDASASKQACTRSIVKRALSRPSSSAAGPVAHWPRQ